MKTASIIVIFSLLAALLVAGCVAEAPPAAPAAEEPAPVPVQIEIVAENVSYANNTTGYLAYPNTSMSLPGIILIHEWWGLNNNIRNETRNIAAKGYYVLAVDLYNGSIARTPEEATNLSAAINQTEAIENMKAAVAYLKEKHNATKIASWGWCFGGGQSMQLAVSGQKLDATVVYYGTPVLEDSKLSAVKWPVLGVFADKDAVIPVQKAYDFKSALTRAGIANEVYIYPGVGHAFANPSNPNYAPNETADAHGKTMDFLKRSLKQAN